MNRRSAASQLPIFRIICLIVCLALIYLTITDLYLTVLHGITVKTSRMDHIELLNINRYSKFRNEKNRVFPKQTPERWNKIKPTFELLNSLRNNTVSHQSLKKKCDSINDLARVCYFKFP